MFQPHELHNPHHHNQSKPRIGHSWIHPSQPRDAALDFKNFRKIFKDFIHLKLKKKLLLLTVLLLSTKSMDEMDMNQ